MCGDTQASSVWRREGVCGGESVCVGGECVSYPPPTTPQHVIDLEIMCLSVLMTSACLVLEDRLHCV